MSAALLDMIGFDTHFPSMAKQQTPDQWDLIAEDDAKREAHVAQVLPDLIRLYSITPEKIRRAFEDVSLHTERNSALVLAVATRDAAELGRLVLACIDARIKEMATDDAEDDGYRVIPERPLT